MQRSPPRLILGIHIRPGLDETDHRFLASAFRGMMQGRGTRVIARPRIAPGLYQEIGPRR